MIRLQQSSDKERFAAAVKSLKEHGITVALSEKAIEKAQGAWVGNDDRKKYDENGNFDALYLSHAGISDNSAHSMTVRNVFSAHGFIVEWDGSEWKSITLHGQKCVADLRNVNRYSESNEKYGEERLSNAHSNIYRELKALGIDVSKHYTLKNAIGDLYSMSYDAVHTPRRKSFDAQSIAFHGGDKNGF